MTKVERFSNRETPFRAWVRRHAEDGYVLNCLKGPKSDSNGRPYLLHRADCRTLDGQHPRTGQNFTTARFYKACSTNLNQLATWGREVAGDEIRRCKLCLDR
jgi:hypothetical protein